VINAGVTSAAANQFLTVKYEDDAQGVIVLSVNDAAKADAYLGTKSIPVTFKFNKRGLSGIPTFLDWDGVVGSVKILLTK
jgi:hypothetical protein